MKQHWAGMTLACGALLCLLSGLVVPSLEFTKLFFLTDRHSIASMIAGLWQQQELFLASILALFSVVFPLLKIGCLIGAGIGGLSGRDDARHWLGIAVSLGRWSMLDVLVLALVIFYIKTTGLADAASLPGIWLFAGSVLLTTAAATQLSRVSV